MYAANQTQLGASESTTDNEQVTVPVLAGQQYYIYVYGKDNAMNPNYDLLIDGPDSDFGDAPAPYPTSLASGGAYHAAVGPTLGFLRDVESNGQPSPLADGDGDDEDGVSFGTTLLDGNYRLDIASAQVKLANGNLAAMAADYEFGGQLKAEANNDDFYRWYGDDNGDGFTGFTGFTDFASGFLPKFGTTRP